jgi:hypothetical protein
MDQTCSLSLNPQTTLCGKHLCNNYFPAEGHHRVRKDLVPNYRAMKLKIQDIKTNVILKPLTLGYVVVLLRLN